MFVCGSVVVLAAQSESLDDSAIARDVAVVEIVEQSAALTYELCQRTGCSVVLVVLLEVLGEVRDAVREERDLAFCRTRVCCSFTELAENLLLCLFVKIHNFCLINVVCNDYISQTSSRLNHNGDIFECTGLSGFAGAKVQILMKNEE